MAPWVYYALRILLFVGDCLCGGTDPLGAAAVAFTRFRQAATPARTRPSCRPSRLRSPAMKLWAPGFRRAGRAAARHPGRCRADRDGRPGRLISSRFATTSCRRWCTWCGGGEGGDDAKADLLVLDMETNGGRADSTEEIIEILSQFKGETRPMSTAVRIPRARSLRSQPSAFSWPLESVIGCRAHHALRLEERESRPCRRRWRSRRHRPSAPRSGRRPRRTDTTATSSRR